MSRLQLPSTEAEIEAASSGAVAASGAPALIRPLKKGEGMFRKDE